MVQGVGKGTRFGVTFTGYSHRGGELFFHA